MFKIAKNILFASLIVWGSQVQAAAKLPPLPVKQLQAVRDYQQQIQAALKTATPAQADKLLLQYVQKYPKLLEAADRADQKFLHGIMTQHVELNKYEQVIGKSAALKAREKQLAKYGLRYDFYAPADMGMIVMQKNHYEQLFGKKVSPAVQAYLAIRAKQTENLFYDQEMVLPYEKVGERVIAWERYLNKYGNHTPLLNHAKCEYIVHQSAFLTGGYDDTGITGILSNFGENPPEKLKPQVRQAWAKYQQKYPKSASSLLIAQMPKKSPYQEPADKIVAAYHKRVGLDVLTPKRCEKLWF